MGATAQLLTEVTEINHSNFIGIFFTKQGHSTLFYSCITVEQAGLYRNICSNFGVCQFLDPLNFNPDSAPLAQLLKDLQVPIGLE